MRMTSQFLWYSVIVKSYWRCFVSLVKLLVQSISSLILEFWGYDDFFYKRLSWNLDIGNIAIGVLPNTRLGQIRDTKFGTDVSNKMLLNAAKCQGYSFYGFWVIYTHTHIHTHIHTHRLGIKGLTWARNTIEKAI